MRVRLWSFVSIGSMTMFPYAVVVPYVTRLSDTWSVVQVMVTELPVILLAETAVIIGALRLIKPLTATVSPAIKVPVNEYVS